MTTIEVPIDKQRIDIKGFYYPVDPTIGCPLVLCRKGARPVLPLCSTEASLAAFVESFTPGMQFKTGRVEQDDFIEVVAHVARLRGEAVTVMCDPEETAPGAWGAKSMIVGATAEVLVAPPLFAVPYRSGGLWTPRCSRYMPFNDDDVPVCFVSEGIHYYPCFEQSEVGEKTLKRLKAPFERMRVVRDPSAVVRAVEDILKCPCRIAVGETMKRKRRGGIECDWCAGASPPKSVGASSTVSLLGKVVPMVVGQGFCALRMLGCTKYYVPVCETAEEARGLFEGQPTKPDGDFAIADEARFLRIFPSIMPDGHEVVPISELRRDGPAVTFNVLSWRN